ncbi:unnamed protein product [Calicophoron daubneyi]|uniref:Uncharacterized protein n=1 Tax=Calicophoron daubneyi TaxID=300641 RepID=A0AAV2T6U6_CALDB
MSEFGSPVQNEYFFNHVVNGANNVQRLNDGTIEVTDNLSKQDYYRSLRRGTSNGRGSPDPGLASQLSLDVGRSGTIKSTFLRKNGPILDYKPSGHEETCYVLMLEGVEREFTIDRNAYGIHLFEKICKALDLRETEYFGLSYRTTLRVDNWLNMRKRISKQLEKQPWKFEFHIRFYPMDVDEMTDDLTRYCLCLQIRQDIISGQLPCSFQTYVMLGAYVVQSEAGDYDSENHNGTEYISNMPFAPQSMQTPKMLQRIVELHKLHKGQTPVQADHDFLENARRLALYGVEFHKAKAPSGEDVLIGVYNQGLLVCRGRLRIGRFLWPQLIRILYKAKTFTIVWMSMNPLTNQRPQTPTQRKNSLGAFLRRRSSDRLEASRQPQTLNFTCSDARLTKRLYDSCTAQHTFFRLREHPGPRRPNLTTAFGTRKYHYTDRVPDPTARISGLDFSEPHRPIKRVATQRRPAQYTSGLAPVAFNEDADQFYLIPGSPSPLPAAAVKMNPLQSLPPAYRRPGPTRTPLAQEHWQMSPADCTQGLGMNLDGTDVAAMPGTDWQGCRANRGLRWPGAYFYEAVMLEEGQVRLGWSTNDSNPIVGADSKGFGYGADESGAGSAAGEDNTGRFVHGNVSQEYGLRVVPGDIIGCYVEMKSNVPEQSELKLQWSHNGKLLEPLRFQSPIAVTPDDPLFPAASLKDARVEFNFGYKPFNFPPKQPSSDGSAWVPVAQVNEKKRIGNWNVGWRVNPADTSSNTNLVVSPNGRMVQAVENKGWQGFRVNKGVRGGGKYYYEVEVVEDSGLARVGWSMDGASLDLGLDAFGYGFGADRDGFGITGLQGKKMHSDVIENYGESFSKGDVIGCFLDLDTGIVQWSKNGRMFGPGYRIDEEYRKGGEPIYPAASLVDTTLELNYGDLPFKFPPDGDWVPLFAAPDEHVFESPSWAQPRFEDKRENEVKSRPSDVQCSTVPVPPIRTSSQTSRTFEQVPASAQVANLRLDGAPNELTDSQDTVVFQEDEVRTYTERGEEEVVEARCSSRHEPCVARSSSFTRAITIKKPNEIPVKEEAQSPGDAAADKTTCVIQIGDSKFSKTLTYSCKS